MGFFFGVSDFRFRVALDVLPGILRLAVGLWGGNTNFQQSTTSIYIYIYVYVYIVEARMQERHHPLP